ncbi:MAG: homoserine dehydrogenase [Minisyncoccia bacterium]|jgi:homoserine dehydrogenase
MGQRPRNVALLGFGTVGSCVARILMERSDLSEYIRLTHIFNRKVERKRVDWASKSVIWTEDIDAVFASKPDVVIELVGDVNSAEAWIRRALLLGMDVVTANKALLATKAPELLRLATEHHARLSFEAAVGGGIPIIRGIHEGLAGDTFTGVVGILNGTCNYILSRMAATGESMDLVLNEAKSLGFAEADPTADVDGHDAAAKLVLLVGVSFKRHLPLAHVNPRSIRGVADVDFKYARELGYTIRQLSCVQKQEDGFCAFVGPALVSLASAFAGNEGANNLVTTMGAHGGRNNFQGAGAGGDPTAVAVVSDLIALLRNGQNVPEEDLWNPGCIIASPSREYYLRFVVKDRPGIVAAITSALSTQSINIGAVVQLPGYPKDHLSFVVTVEACEENTLERALEEIGTMDFHAQTPLVLPIWN